MNSPKKPGGIGVVAIVALAVQLLGNATPCAGAVNWIFDGIGRWVDEAKAVTPDGEGGYYLVGRTFSSQTDFDYLTVRFDSEGRVRWQTLFNTNNTPPGDAPSCMAVAADHSVCVGGESGIVAYNADGVRMWTSTNFQVISLATGPGGRLHALGSAFNAAGNRDLIVQAYDALGSLIWSDQYDGAEHGEDEPTAMVVDAPGNVYVASRSDRAMLVLKYSSAGVVQWAKTVAGTESRPTALAALGDGVIVTGASDNAALTVRLDSTGEEVWRARQEAQFGCFPYAIVTDVDESSVWVTTACGTIRYDAQGRKVWWSPYGGRWARGDASGNLYLAAADSVLKLTPQGLLLWSASTATPAKGFALGTGAVFWAGDTGYDIVAGLIAETPLPTNSTPWVAITHPLDRSTHIAGSRIPIVAAAGDVEAPLTRVDFLAGTTVLGSRTRPPFVWDWTNSLPGNPVITVRAQDSSGLVSTSSVRVRINPVNTPPVVRWLEPVESKYEGLARIQLRGEATDIDGRVVRVEFLNGTNLIASVARPPYQATWTRVRPGSYLLRMIAVDERGGRTEARPRRVTVKNNLIGGVEEAWVAEFDGAAHSHDVPTAVRVDAFGNVYVAGLVDGGDAGLMKYDSDGNRLWDRSYAGAAGNGDEFKALTFTTEREVVAGGFTVVNNATKDFLLVKYDQDGNERWARTFAGPYGDDEINSVTSDHEGNVIVAGVVAVAPTVEYGNDIQLVKYSAAGDVAWAVQYDGGRRLDDGAFGVATDAGGAVYVAGSSKMQVSGNVDAVILKFSPEGQLLWSNLVSRAATDIGAGVIVDRASANVYLVALVDVGTPKPRLALIQYSSEGVELNRAYQTIPGLKIMRIYGIQFDGTGALYVTGSTPVEGREDYLTARYQPRKGLTWLARYNGLDSGSDGARAMTVDGFGNVFVTGYATSNGDLNAVTIKYRPKVAAGKSADVR